MIYTQYSNKKKRKTYIHCNWYNIYTNPFTLMTNKCSLECIRQLIKG